MALLLATAEGYEGPSGSFGYLQPLVKVSRHIILVIPYQKYDYLKSKMTAMVSK